MEPIDNPVETQLADLLESYPSSFSPGFQTIITSKKEFNELKLEPMERLPPGRGKFYKHQKFTHRYLRAYDSLIITSQPGSGKSCESLGFIEAAFAERDKARKDPTRADEKLSHLKQAIILVKGPTQKSEVRNQLVCKCSNGHFETANVRKARSEVSQKSAVTAEIKEAGYIIMTYTSFARHVLRKFPEDDTGLSDQELADFYADTIFWIDEAHNLLVDAFTGKQMREKQQTYQTIARVLRLAKRSKKILSTATPMINDPQEIGYLLNLILPPDGIIPNGYDYRKASPNDIRVLFPNLPKNINYKTASREVMAPYFRGQIPSNYDFNTATLEDLEPFLRGRIGFVRASDTGTVTRNMGEKLDDVVTNINGIEYRSGTVIYASRMSDFQSEAYERAIGDGSRKDDLRGAERQAGNFVFPDGYWGNGITEEERLRRQNKTVSNDEDIDVQVLEDDSDNNITRHGFRRYVIVNNNDTYVATKELKEYLTKIEYINTLSCKYASIVDIVSRGPGNAFVYGEYVEGSGAIVLGLCFEGMGFERYNETRSMFIGSNINTIKPYCGGGTSNNSRAINPNFEKRPRYALLTRGTNEAKFQSMMELFNSYENRHGEYIKVLIASRVGRDGINVNNGQQVHLVGSEWNQSAMYQALSRVFRATSHEDLLNEERARLIAEGGDPADARVIVEVYKHAAVSQENNSVDAQMYLLSEFKDRAISRIMRMLKQCSIGCQTHYARNVRDTDVDYSAECDFDICHYSCVDPDITAIDYSTYDVLYASEVVEALVDSLLTLFRQYNALDIDTICASVNENRKYVIMALEHLIVKKYPIIDRFGYKTYLREDRGYFYLDKVYPVGEPSAYPMSYYTNGLIAIESEPLSVIVTELQAVSNQVISNELSHIDPNSKEFIETLKSLSIEGQTEILENACLLHQQGDDSDYVRRVMDFYKGVLFMINDPVTALNTALKESVNKVTKRGRKPLPQNEGKPLKDISGFKFETNTEIVYLHIMQSLAEKATAYAVSSSRLKAEGKIRLFKPSENIGWRDVNIIEFQIYNAYIRLTVSERVRLFEEKYRIYGTMYGGVFRVIDKVHESGKAVKDRRSKKRGRNCKELNSHDIVDSMYNSGVPFPNNFTYTQRTQNEKKSLVRSLAESFKTKYSAADIESWSLDRISYYMSLLSSTESREVLCDLLFNYMRDNDMIKE